MIQQFDSQAQTRLIQNANAKLIVRKQGQNDPTWEADARALYKQIIGKDFILEHGNTEI
jgi:hypothetical protein